MSYHFTHGGCGIKPFMDLYIIEKNITFQLYYTENIYKKATTEEELKEYKKMFRTVFDCCKKDIENNNKDSLIYQLFLEDKCSDYLNNTTSTRKVIDFIAGMTDDYMKNCYLKMKK